MASKYFRVDVQPTAAIVHVNGATLLANEVPQFESELLRFLDDHKTIIIDLDDVERLPNSGVLGIFAGLHVRMNKQRGVVRFCNVHSFLAEQVSITNLDRLLDIHGDIDSALRGLP